MFDNFLESLSLESFRANVADQQGLVPIKNGSTRKVYEITQGKYSGHVLKVEPGGEENRREWETWNAVRGTDAEQYFAPIHYISDNGEKLVMEKVDETPTRKADHDEIRDALDTCESIPRRYTDINTVNVGYYQKTPVLFDYPIL